MEWVKGSLLTDYRRRLVRTSLRRTWRITANGCLAELPPQRPLPADFRRLLLWGRLGGDARRQTGT